MQDSPCGGTSRGRAARTPRADPHTAPGAGDALQNDKPWASRTPARSRAARHAQLAVVEGADNCSPAEPGQAGGPHHPPGRSTRRRLRLRRGKRAGVLLSRDAIRPRSIVIRSRQTLEGAHCPSGRLRPVYKVRGLMRRAVGILVFCMSARSPASRRHPDRSSASAAVSKRTGNIDGPIKYGRYYRASPGARPYKTTAVGRWLSSAIRSLAAHLLVFSSDSQRTTVGPTPRASSGLRASMRDASSRRSSSVSDHCREVLRAVCAALSPTPSPAEPGTVVRRCLVRSSLLDCRVSLGKNNEQQTPTRSTARTRA